MSKNRMISSINIWLQRLFYLAISRNVPPEVRQRRSRSVVQGTLSAIGVRGLGSVIGLITVHLTVHYLGPERYGIWMTITAWVAFLGFADLGIGSSVTNVLARSFGTGDVESARRYVSTALCLFSLIGLAVALLGIICAKPLAQVTFPSVSAALMQREVVPCFVVALAVFGLSFPLFISSRLLATHQQTAKANLWIMAGSVANLGGILIAVYCRAPLPWLVIGSTAPGFIVSLVCTIWVFGWQEHVLRPAFSAVRPAEMRELFSSGWKFFVTTTAWLINSQTDNIVIAHFLGPTQVTPYSVTFRLFAYATLIQSFASASLWPAYTEAMAKRDYEWIYGVYRKQLQSSIAIAVVIVVLLLIFGRAIIQLWAGQTAVPSVSVLWWMAIWNIILALMWVPSTILNASGNLLVMTIYGPLTAILNLVLSILFVQRFGVAGVIAGTVISFLVAAIVPTFREANRTLRDLAGPEHCPGAK